MSYYLGVIESKMDWLDDNGQKRFNHESIKEIKIDIQSFRPITQCGVQFKNDVKNEVGMDVSKDHNQSYYISDFADHYRYHYIKRFLKELKTFLEKVKSPILKGIIESVIETYEDKEWLLLHYSKKEIE
jgi:hypothetical protein